MVFVDSWAWIALALKNDQHHVAASRAHAAFLRSRETYVTTDYVLAEVITLLYRSTSAEHAAGYVDAIRTGIEHGRYKLISITPERFEAAWRLRKRYADKPRISFSDFTSIAVMLELEIVNVFTGDAHFGHVNLGFELQP